MRGVSDPRTVVAVVVKTDALLAKICTRALAYYGAAPLSLLTRGIAAAQSVRTGPLFVAPLRTSRCAPLARAAHGDHSYWLDRRPECLMSMRVYCGSQVFMVRSELVSKLMKKNPHLTARDAALLINTIFAEIAAALSRGDRVELRGFGNFSTRARAARVGLNPSTGARVHVADKRVPHFKPSLRMRTLLNAG